MSLRLIVFNQVLETAQQQDRRMAPLSNDLKLLDSGLDSLCLAIIIAKLEDELGLDPFSESSYGRLPVTFGDLVHLYEKAAEHAGRPQPASPLLVEPGD